MAESGEMEPPKRRVLLTQQSTIWTRKQHAVCVRRAVKRYGTKKCPTTILNELNMTVPRGKIYGLLGASGCGKTTLLSCIVGRRRLNAGEIWVLGGRPGSPGSGVPGPRIGYMPQEIALYGEFTIQETFIYFGWISGLTKAESMSKMEFLLKLLMLPTSTRQVKNLSGGQQRRVSFAAALLHDPELLILDEPTVGVDPLLRQAIWDYLVKITSDGNRTVIITTHYIEETRQAGMIGLLRGGRFLAEDTPDNLMRQYNAETLEDVFLRLSVMQNMGKRRRSSFMQELIGVNEDPDIGDPPGEDGSEISGEFGDAVHEDRAVVTVVQAEPIPPEEEPEQSFCERLRVFDSNHMRALIWKNFLWMWRNVGVMCYVAGLPIAECIIFCLAIGHDPHGLKFAVVNQELNGASMCPMIFDKNLDNLGCRFLKQVESRDIELLFRNDTEDGKELVRRGKAWGLLEFQRNFSKSLNDRVELGRSADDYSIEFSNVNVWMDASDQQILHLMNRQIYQAFSDFAEELALEANVSAKAALPPIRLNDPIYGDKVPNFTDFAAPGIILSLVFFLSVASTSGALLMERNEGQMERTLVLGVSGAEMLFSHVVTQFVTMLFQSIFIHIFVFGVFGITNHGSIMTIFMLVALTGVCGMSFGFVVSCTVDSERNATYLSLGSFLPIILLCGIIWPIEGMHYTLRFVALFLPLTKSTESLRSVMQKGWGMNEASVYLGFVATSTWILVFMSASLLALKFKKG